MFYIQDTSEVKMSLHKHLCKLDNFANLSSHDALVGKIILPISSEVESEPDYSSSYTPFVVPKPKWNESGLAGYQKQSADVLQNLANQFKSVDDIPILSELFSKMLVISAEKNFETVTPAQKKGKKTKTLFPQLNIKLRIRNMRMFARNGESKDDQMMQTTRPGLQNLHPSVIYRKFRTRKSHLKPGKIAMT